MLCWRVLFLKHAMLNEAPTMHPFLNSLLPSCCCWKTPLVFFSFQIGCIHQVPETPKGFGGLSTVKVRASTVFFGLWWCDLYSFPAVSLASKPSCTSRSILNHIIFMLHLIKYIQVALLLLSMLQVINLYLGIATQSWSHQEYAMFKITVMVVLVLILAIVMLCLWCWSWK